LVDPLIATGTSINGMPLPSITKPLMRTIGTRVPTKLIDD
jgi:hypothetical protein